MDTKAALPTRQEEPKQPSQFAEGEQEERRPNGYEQQGPTKPQVRYVELLIPSRRPRKRNSSFPF